MSAGFVGLKGWESRRRSLPDWRGGRLLRHRSCRRARPGKGEGECSL